MLGPIFSRPSHFSPPRQPTAPCHSHRPMGPAPSAALFAARITHPGYSRSLPETLTCGPSSSELSNLPAPNPSREPCGVGPLRSVSVGPGSWGYKSRGEAPQGHTHRVPRKSYALWCWDHQVGQPRGHGREKRLREKGERIVLPAMSTADATSPRLWAPLGIFSGACAKEASGRLGPLPWADGPDHHLSPWASVLSTRRRCSILYA